jgi:hypothetical protein
MSESVQYKMDVTDLDHGRTGFYTTLIGLDPWRRPPYIL